MAQRDRRLQLRERIHVVKEYYLGSRSYKHVINAWPNEFRTLPPVKSSIYQLISKFERLGTVTDSPRSGPPFTERNEQNRDLVAAAFIENRQLSQRRAAVELGISRRSLGRIMDDLGLKPYRPRRLQALNGDDPDRRLQFCETFLAYVNEDPDVVNKIIWTDEAQFKLNGRVNRHNCVYWSDSNPHEILTSEVNSPGVTVWAGICSTGLIGPFFFDGTVDSVKYLAMLQEQFLPAATNLIDVNNFHFQQDGAPPHYGLNVRQWLDSTFPGRWLGRRGPIEWPARSPDLSPPDFFLWGVLKDRVFAQKPRTIASLKDTIRKECEKITPAICHKVTNSVVRRYDNCIQANGHQFEHLS